MLSSHNICHNPSPPSLQHHSHNRGVLVIPAHDSNALQAWIGSPCVSPA